MSPLPRIFVACVASLALAGPAIGGAIEKDCNTFGGFGDAIMIIRQSGATRAEADSAIFELLVHAEATLTTEDYKTAYALITLAYESRVEDAKSDQEAAVAAFGQRAARICEDWQKSQGGALP